MGGEGNTSSIINDGLSASSASNIEAACHHKYPASALCCQSGQLSAAGAVTKAG